MRKLGEKTGEFLRRRNLKGGVMSRSLKVDFVHFYFLLLFFSFPSFLFFSVLFFSFLFLFLFLEQLGLGVISHAVTSVTS